ncbi:MAG: hypothetical protein Q7R84_03055 [bacterium]|nr:hypothetical protein [bacterium]
MTTDIYKKTILNSLPRILSNCDRNKYSSSFGCFDRNFWHYKIIDIPSARLQEGVLTLALLYLDSENSFFQKDYVKKLIEGGLNFWLKIQGKEGSFNEWYPHEKSFVATAFSSYAVSETLILLSDMETKKEIIAGLKKAGDWLLGRRDNQALNQNAGALAALYNIFLLTGEEKYEKECQKLVEFFKKNQNEEGWFPEYGGADIGYLSLTLDYMAKYYLKSKNRNVLPILEKGLDFLSNFIHPDGSAGGIYGSRSTSYIIPSGIEILANFSSLARMMSSVLQESIKNNCITHPEMMDDRYLIQNGYNYMEASLQFKQRSSFNEEAAGNLPSFSFNDKHFPRAGFWIKSNPAFYCIINYKKGGAVYCYDRLKKSNIYNSGILLRRGEKSYSSSWISEQNKIIFSQDNKNILIKGRLQEAVGHRPTTFRFVVLRILLGLGQFIPYFTVFMKSALRNFLISRKTASSFYFERSFHIDNNMLIKDRFPAGVFDKGYIGGIFEPAYTPSSRYFNNDFVNSPGKLMTEKELIRGEAEYSLRGF